MLDPAITIRRQVLEVEVQGSASDGLVLQQRLPGVCTDVLSPALVAAFAEIDAGDAHLYVERLTIDVSEIALDRLETELAEAVRREVADYFRRQPPASAAATGAGKPGRLERRTIAETVDEALVAYLRTGRLPWSFQVAPGSRLEQIVLDAWLRAGADARPPPATLARLCDVLARPGARSRLLLQFTPAFVAIVLRDLAPASADAVEQILNLLDEIDAPAPARPRFTTQVWDVALAAASGGRRLEPAELARAAWGGSSMAEREDRVLANVLERCWPGTTEQAGRRAAADPVPPPRPAPSQLPVTVDQETDGILVDNAGVVLLHPFLLRLFAAIGIAVDDHLRDAGRGLCLVHHLATGELTAPEHRLVLAKVLCGLALDEPVAADVGITEGETEEAGALLLAVIRHWEALRGTSPDALRAEFLMRPGMLALRSDGEWLLRVEARTVDILLGQLPWGISLVKLPWMPTLLRVEWH